MKREDYLKGYFAIILDVNHFTKMCLHPRANLMANFIRDVFYGPAKAVEEKGGKVVNFMGDAMLAILPNKDSAMDSLFGIADDIYKQKDYFASVFRENPDAFPFTEGQFTGTKGSGLENLVFRWGSDLDIWTFLLMKDEG